ncbi:hypothetical protein ABWK31_14225, partial [Bacillus sp. JJ353]|uniref:hypothetical protein n=1 Tax=Bacillus sp. JJ353 TaxID=3122967 RepID=UPI0033991AD8
CQRLTIFYSAKWQKVNKISVWGDDDHNRCFTTLHHNEENDFILLAIDMKSFCNYNGYKGV